MEKLWYLKKCDLFQGLSRESMDRVMAVANDKTVPKKRIIYSPSEENSAIYILKKGRVRIFKLSPEGKTIILAILNEGDVFGAMSPIREGSSTGYAETLEDSYICSIEQDKFNQILAAMPEVALGMMEKISRRLKEAEDRIEDLVFRDVPGRIASVLLNLSSQFGTEGPDGLRIDFKFTHQDLADMVGASRETVTVILNEFKDDGIIRIDDRFVTIRNLTELKAWAGKD